MFSHLVVPIASSPDTALAVHPAAAMARAFEATVVVLAHASVDVDLDQVLADVGSADVAAVSVTAERSLTAALERLQHAFPNPLLVCTGDLAPELLDDWPGALLVFGPASSPRSYGVGGSILLDATIDREGASDLRPLGRAFGFDYEATTDLTAVPSAGDTRVAVPRRTNRAAIDHLIANREGPVFVLADPAGASD